MKVLWMHSARLKRRRSCEFLFCLGTLYGHNAAFVFLFSSAQCNVQHLGAAKL